MSHTGIRGFYSLILIPFLLLISCSGTLNEADALYDAGDYKAAESSYRSSLDADPDNAQAHFMLGMSLQAQNKHTEAKKEFEISYKLDKNNKKAITSLQVIYSKDAKSKLNAGEIEDAIAIYKKGYSLNKNDPGITLGLAQAYTEYGLLTLASELLEKAGRGGREKNRVEEIKTEIEKRRTVAESNYVKGKKAYDNNNIVTAKKYLDKAISNNRDSDDIRYYSFMSNGLYLYKKGSRWQIWDAIVEFGKAAEVRTKEAEPNYYLALGYLKKDDKDFENILSYYEKALELDTDGQFTSKIKKELDKQRKRKKKLDEFWGK